MPRLSELPDFLPAGEPGSPERRACALGTFSDRTANSIGMTALLKSAVARLAAAHAPSAPTHHDSTSAPRVREGVSRG